MDTRQGAIVMKKILLALALAAGAGACTPYKDALCHLSSASTEVAKHYAEYVNADTDADRKAAREAEAKQFQKAVDESKTQCAQ
jgi:hypothetical protein